MKYIALMVVAIIITAGCNKKKSVEKSDMENSESGDSIITSLTITEAQFRNAGIQLGYLNEQNMSESIKVSGYIEVPPQDVAQIATYIGGIVKSILLQEGNFVKKGQAVIILEHPDFIKLQQEYIASKSNLSYLEKEYQRQKLLSENNAGTGKVYQEIESKYNTEKGNVLALKSQLSILSISTDALDKGEITRTISLKAPIDGYVGHFNISVGGYAEPNKSLVDITNNSHLVAHLDVFEKDIVKISNGQKVFINLPNQSIPDIEGQIFWIGKSVSDDTKTISIRANITDNKHVLISGMFVNGFININNLQSKVIPEDAVIRAGEKQYVFMATDAWCANPNAKNGSREALPISSMGKDSVALSYKMIEVQTGSSDNGLVSITLPESESSCIMVIKGAYYLMSQLKSGETIGCCGPEETEEETKK